MFIKKDLINAESYNSIKEVEYLEFICRVAINNFRDQEQMSIPEKVFELLSKIWDYRNKKSEAPAADGKKKKRRKKKFPVLKPLIDEEEDSD